MALFDEIKQRLEDQGLAEGGTGWEVWKDWMPDSPDKVILVREVSGQPPQDHAETDFRQFELFTRGGKNESADAETKLDAIFRDLHTLGPVTLSGRSYGGIVATVAPHWFRVDQSQRDEFRAVFQALRART